MHFEDIVFLFPPPDPTHYIPYDSAIVFLGVSAVCQLEPLWGTSSHTTNYPNRNGRRRKT